MHESSINLAIVNRYTGERRICTGYLAPDLVHWKVKDVWLDFANDHDLEFLNKAVPFKSEKQAWFFWVRYRDSHPDLAAGWDPEVYTYEM